MTDILPETLFSGSKFGLDKTLFKYKIKIAYNASFMRTSTRLHAVQI